MDSIQDLMSPNKAPKRQVSFLCPWGLLRKVDAQCKKFKMSRSHFLAQGLGFFMEKLEEDERANKEKDQEKD